VDVGTRIRGALGRAAVRNHARNEGPPRRTREDVHAWARAHLPDRPLVVVSNREPYSHYRDGDRLRWARNSGGLTVALDSVAQAIGGVWVAHGSGTADRASVDARDRVACPPDNPSYTLRRVWITPEEMARYYSGFANSALWPLCHIAYVRPRFRLDDWQAYDAINRRFADAVLQELDGRPALVFVQDYHLATLPAYLKAARPDLQVAMFWHIPWPNPEVFRILPWRHELIEGLLATDLLGFHIRQHAMNFLQTVSETVEARVDPESMAVNRGSRRTWVRAFPISVDADEIAALAQSPAAEQGERALRERYGLEELQVGLGIDRLDYTKGIPERLQALHRLFEKRPEWIGRFAYIQIGVPSRIELQEYRAVQRRARYWIDRINQDFPRLGGPTAVFLEENMDFRELIPYYRMADLCAVTALHDGMNLVAKEYLAASPDLEGALVLSPFTGAARELERAWIASPYDREGLADAYHAALLEPEAARRERMAALRETVLRRNIYDWTLEVLDAAVSLGLRTPQAEEAAPPPAP
jgi:trehalose-6-phosphate synthase